MTDAEKWACNKRKWNLILKFWATVWGVILYFAVDWWTLIMMIYNGP